MSKLKAVETGIKIKWPQVKTRVLQADFANTNMEYFDEKILNQVTDIDISLVIVNAGFMHQGPFQKQTGESLQKMLDANVYHAAAMLNKFIKVLEARESKSAMILTASLACLTPLTNNAVYHATKVFGSHLCEGIQTEL